MKKYLFLLAFVGLFNAAARGAAGDTTWVQANINQLSWFGNYDTTINFPSPGTNYRNIYMIFTLGKYMCPAGSTYCGDWDYTVQNFLMTPGGDTLELGRLITPYASAGAPRTPWTWTQRYVYDVTDYVSKLQGSNTIRIHYSGYSGGFTANIKFAFVEGTPDRDVLGIERLWHGSFPYGGTPDINTNFTALTRTAPSGTQSAELKYTITGHGSDANYCCEFLSKNYDVVLNGSSIATKAIWRACGNNHLYPQSGTWIYDRANWCPGEITYSHLYKLPGVLAGSTYNVALQFEPYTGSGGSYTTEATLIHYGGLNKTLDASVEDIIAPTNHEDHFRDNPICDEPSIRVKNRGAAAITSLQIEYGVKDSAMTTYNWSGSLESLRDTIIKLPAILNLKTLSGVSATHNFIAKITAVNGGTDVDNTNDAMVSQFKPSPRWDSVFKVVMNTNNAPEAAGSTVSETKWQIFDWDNNVVASRTDASISTSYIDTVRLTTGCYRLVITDGSCDGLHWWVHGSAGTGVTSGTFFVKKLNNVNIPMNGYNYGGTFGNDFGCSYSQYFFVQSSIPAGVTELANGDVSIDAYPNPAQNTVTVNIAGLNKVEGVLHIVDAIGRVVTEVPATELTQQINTSALTNGLYIIRFVGNTAGKLQTRLLIAK